ncbi:hypothetical protein ARAM_006531 [Aspergillus rambellii]|uniref:DUF159 domain protein n=1 Tax=Aspergillus rambellii TaxID=308745 RepID=A0A0F8WQ64_9EURO|nr:hypothetical protein ARAM_006531 [Aspergillus rambellii]
MCGRYALGVRMTFIRNRLQEQGMDVDEPSDNDDDDDDIRETYNFAPGNIGAVYRADVPDYGGAPHQKATGSDAEKEPAGTGHGPTTHYKLQGMKWGLVPFWTKRQPDYGSLMRTINCRDDSLRDDRGMWTSMKRKKRCVVVCQGFYEWLKTGPGGKEKIPHFIRRKDGDLMYLAGLWDCVTYEGSEEKLYTYTVITTSATPSLNWLHDRMPVILDPNSEALRTWLDPKRTTWSKELQSILKPYDGELESYQVPKEVGKVGNNSPDFIVPLKSKENKSNIANFFADAKKKAGPGAGPEHLKSIGKHGAKPVSGTKRGHPDISEEAADEEDIEKQKTESSTLVSPPKKRAATQSPTLNRHTPNQKQMRSATHNQKPSKKVDAKKPSSGAQRITTFFSK